MKWAWIAIYVLVLVWSGIAPKNYFTWFLEVAPALIGVAVLAATYSGFKLTRLLYVLILVHCIVLMVGGHYSYAEVPLFDYLKSVFDFDRNNYDKLGHFMQGFMPVILAREIFIRRNIVNTRFWINMLAVSVCLAFSGFYEILECAVAIISGDSAKDFLGTQGYQWDTQTDMLLALVGAIAALLLLSGWHDRQLSKVRG